ncbi:MAG: HTH domain-containing protein, partial [Verrucomicrobiota bacterium]
MASDARLLAALRETSDGFISGAELAEMAGLSRSSLRARIEELRALGYEIASNPHQGYRLLNLPDVLHADQIESLLGRRRVVG